MTKRRVNLHIPEDLYLWVKDQANLRGTTMTAVINILLEKEKKLSDESRKPEQY